LSRTPRPNQDNPVIREIREIRARLWREGGRTMRGYLDLIRRRSAERAAGEADKEREKRSA
jgi:hypothetical protein